MAFSDKKNRGEWSELFVLVDLLATGELHYENKNSSLNNPAFPVISISRSVGGSENRFQISDGYVEILDAANEKILSRVSQEVLQKLSRVLLSEIKKGEGRVFAVPCAADIMSTLKIEKATGIQGKDDLKITIYDPRTKQQNCQGFSIKSFLGSNPTILNASGVTNIEFTIEGRLSQDEIKALNKLGPISLVSNLLNNGYKLSLSNIDNRFAENLEMIDSEMVSLLSHIVIASYEGRGRTMPDIVQKLTDKNPLNYSPSNSENRYTHKIKDLLEAATLGMRPSEPWSGKLEAEGGNLIVTSTGDILCQHALDKGSLRDYLFLNTYVDTPSRNKWKFGYINGDKLNLNFQIRVKKITA